MSEHVMTDDWDPYAHCVPADTPRQSKAETFTVAGYNRLFRHCRARVRRKTNCASKREPMWRYAGMR